MRFIKYLFSFNDIKTGWEVGLYSFLYPYSSLFVIKTCLKLTLGKRAI